MKPSSDSLKIKQQLSRWITCFALVSFDVNEGQKVDLVVPNVQFSHETEKQIAMLAFPDSNSFSDQENTFKYTFKSSNGLFGFTCFKQKKDEKNPRGFSQKSFVILSELPFVYFFQKMAEFIVFKTFNTLQLEEFEKILQEICTQVSKWPDPTPKSSYILPVLQYELMIDIPNYVHSKEKSYSMFSKRMEEEVEAELKEAKKQFDLKTILTQQQMLKDGPFQELQLSEIFWNCKEGLWILWESIMLNRSVILLGGNPQQVSHGVLGGISLIYPFEYCGNFNPYITIYDPNLETLSSEKQNWILGGTNPVFSKFFKPETTMMVALHSNFGTFKCPKNIKPIKDLIRKSNSEEQKVINEAAIHKHFHQLSRAVLTILDSYLNQQTNSLKFFNEVEFMKMLKQRKDFLGLENIFSSKKEVVIFFERFMQSGNLGRYLCKKNAIKNRR